MTQMKSKNSMNVKKLSRLAVLFVLIKKKVVTSMLIGNISWINEKIIV